MSRFGPTSRRERADDRDERARARDVEAARRDVDSAVRDEDAFARSAEAGRRDHERRAEMASRAAHDEQRENRGRDDGGRDVRALYEEAVLAREVAESRARQADDEVVALLDAARDDRRRQGAERRAAAEDRRHAADDRRDAEADRVASHADRDRADADRDQAEVDSNLRWPPRGRRPGR